MYVCMYICMQVCMYVRSMFVYIGKSTIFLHRLLLSLALMKQRQHSVDAVLFSLDYTRRGKLRYRRLKLVHCTDVNSYHQCFFFIVWASADCLGFNGDFCVLLVNFECMLKY